MIYFSFPTRNPKGTVIKFEESKFRIIVIPLSMVEGRYSVLKLCMFSSIGLPLKSYILQLGYFCDE